MPPRLSEVQCSIFEAQARTVAQTSDAHFAFRGSIMMQHIIVSFLVAACFVGAELTVVVPSNVFPEGIDHQMLRFGRPLLRGKVMAPLVFASPRTLDANTTSNLRLPGIRGCPDLLLANTTATERSYRLVLVETAANCSVVDQVRQVQAFGAMGAIVYDASVESAQALLQATDTSATDIVIPSTMIPSLDATVLRHLLQQDSAVVIMLRWSLAMEADHMAIALYTASITSSLQPLVTSLATLTDAFGPETLHFTPHFEVYPAHEWGCDGPVEDNPNCQSLCLGDYCTYDPDNDPASGYRGSDILGQNLRLWCIHELYPSIEYFEYLQRVAGACTPENQQCFVAQGEDRINMTTVQECMDANATKVFQREVQHLFASNLNNFPFLTVDDQPLYESWNCPEPISFQTCSILVNVCNYFGYLNASALPPPCAPSYWDNRCVAPFQVDACGSCLLPENPAWNQACSGCDGVLFSNKLTDMCGVCGGDGSFDVCGQCLPANDTHRDKICADCLGEPWGAAVVDPCGTCNGHGSFDACGLCFEANDPRRQNYECHVLDDPNAVRVKFLIQGMRKSQFSEHARLQSFTSTLASLMQIENEDVHIKSIESVGSNAVVVNVFGVIDSDTAKHAAAAASANATEALMAAMDPDGVADVRIKMLATAASGDDTQEPYWKSTAALFYVSSIAGLALSIVSTVFLLRRRDARWKLEMNNMMARYTPLVQMEDGN
ncbi:Aste57867_9888 [Aphanomyces stellatus]|uniref:Aste57867_9888 protein n=1 Tax=Aphanomyces stellatus TaxID=120398 RepID=A0A485KPQ4_9STRA|nr:hypothetical protein As57867_009849 [Aphanomyces stellatus]VFT86767.1 Aste57867_9888 [Aphanomyces stellatus]